jgi:transcriptional regulator with XRE-family HTH domain
MKAIDRTLSGSTPGDSLGRRFLQSRMHRAVSRRDAAEAIGISAGQLGKIERGGVQMVSEPSTIIRAANLYGVPQVWLYCGSAGGSRFVPEWYSVAEVQ